MTSPFSSPLNLEMERGCKIVLTGANGIGKTTLLKSILGLIPALSGKVELGDYLEIGYFEQEMSQDVFQHLYRRNLAGLPGLFPVRSPLRPGQVRSDHEAHRKPGSGSFRRRTGQSAALQTLK